jgi:hypothetical protein
MKKILFVVGGVTIFAGSMLTANYLVLGKKSENKVIINPSFSVTHEGTIPTEYGKQVYNNIASKYDSQVIFMSVFQFPQTQK